ncbi:hypothetical protein HDU93_002766 [Gonapodya sp. JEL0774]|nr:hypothetical protein HDU93_002766 [Gonapodya sp. JEL0774]
MDGVNKVAAKIPGVQYVANALGIPPVAVAAAGAAVIGSVAYLSRKEKVAEVAGLDGKSFDFIIVGAGSAGSVLASRLSENPNISVLLLEAGRDNTHFNVQRMLGYFDLQLSEFDWQFKSTPQPNTYGRVHFWVSSVVLWKKWGKPNLTLYLFRALSSHEDALWAGARPLMPASTYAARQRSEQLTTVDGRVVSLPEHGTKGPLNVTYHTDNDVHPYSKHIRDSFVNTGLVKKTDDYNGKEQRGVGYIQHTVGSDGFRTDAYTSWIIKTSAEKRKNLTIATLSQVTKVLFDHNKRAIGVQFRHGKNVDELRKAKDQAVYARKEVILSGGAVCSPWILMNSGIGPAAHLRQVGIQPLVDNSATVSTCISGSVDSCGNFSSCLILCADMFLLQSFETKERGPLATAEFSIDTIGTVLNALIFRRGLLRTLGLETMVFMDSGVSNNELRERIAPSLTAGASLLQVDAKKTKADLQFHSAPTFFAGNPTFLGNVLKPLNLTSVDPEGKVVHAYTLLPTLLNPKSVGFVALKSADPFEYPVVEVRQGYVLCALDSTPYSLFHNLKPNYLSHPDDLKVLINGLKIGRKVAATEPLKSLTKREVPDANVKADPSDEEAYLEEVVRRNAVTVYHPTSSCRMGPDGDPNSVVDLRCRVKGVTGLRIVDASIFPDIVMGNTNAPTYVVAERAADLIKEDYKLGL